MHHTLENLAQIHFVHKPKSLSIEAISPDKKSALTTTLKNQLKEMEPKIHDKRFATSFKNVISYIENLEFGNDGYPAEYIEKIATTRKVPQKIKDDLNFLGITLN